MTNFCAVNENFSAVSMIPKASASRYAWLEHAKGNWHFLTSLFADVQESTRTWSNKQRALDELIKEGWTVVGSYPENTLMPRLSSGEAVGYGLMWTGN